MSAATISQALEPETLHSNIRQLERLVSHKLSQDFISRHFDTWKSRPCRRRCTSRTCRCL